MRSIKPNAVSGNAPIDYRLRWIDQRLTFAHFLLDYCRAFTGDLSTTATCSTWLRDRISVPIWKVRQRERGATAHWTASYFESLSASKEKFARFSNPLDPNRRRSLQELRSEQDGELPKITIFSSYFRTGKEAPSRRDKGVKLLNVLELFRMCSHREFRWEMRANSGSSWGEQGHNR